MSVRIRLRRVGRKKQPYYRVVVARSEAPRDGAYIDEVGFYNPRTRPAFLTMDLDKVDAWIGKGAEVTESAASLIRKARKGGDAQIRFVRPGEEAPALKTATKPLRRPASRPAGDDSPPEVEPVTDPLEGAAPDAEKEAPAQSATGGATGEAVASTETMAPKSGKAATSEEEPAAGSDGAAEAPEAEAPEAEAAEAEAPKARAAAEPPAEDEAAREAEAVEGEGADEAGDEAEEK